MASYVAGRALAHGLAAGYNSGAISANTVGSVVKAARPLFSTAGRVASNAILAGGMARALKRKRSKYTSRFSKRRKRFSGNKGSGTVIGQYVQRSGRNFVRRRRRGRRGRGSVKQQLFRLLPVQSLMVTNMPGGTDVGYGNIHMIPNSKQAWTHIGMYGSVGVPGSDLNFTANQDQDLWNVYKQYASDSIHSGAINNAKNINSAQFYILNSHVDIDILYKDGFPFGSAPAEVTFYVVQPRKSQRVSDKLDTSANSTFLDKFKDYFAQDRQSVTGTGTTAFNEINPQTTYGCTPFDSNTLCKEWIIRSQKKIIVNEGQTASFSWSRARTHKVRGADLDEYDYQKGVFTSILIRMKPLGETTTENLQSPFIVRYTKKYNYKVIAPSQSSSVVGVTQDAPNLS